MFKKLSFLFLTLIMVSSLYTPTIARCSIWRSGDIVKVNKNDHISGDKTPKAAIGYSSDHTEDVEFTVTLLGAEWDYEKTGKIMQGVTYRLQDDSTMSVYVDVGTSDTEHNFQSRSVFIPLYCKVTEGGEIKFKVDGEYTTVSSATVTFAKCVDGVMSAGGKSVGMNAKAELGNIWIKDESSQSLKKNSVFTLELDNSFKFTNEVEPVGTGKFEGNCKFTIDSKNASKAYVTITNDTPTGVGRITLSGLVVERSTTSKFNVVLMSVSSTAGIVKLDTSFAVGSYNSTDKYIDTTVASSTETTTETTTNSETSTTQTTTSKEVVSSNDIVIAIGASTYTVGSQSYNLDAPAFIADGYTMLPLRALANAFGITDENISFDSETKTATLSPMKDVQVSITANESSLYVNGVEVPIDSPAVISNGRLFLPLRAMANALGIDNNNINYDNETKTITIKN